MKVVSAVSSEDWPVAVATNVTPRSCASNTRSVLVKLPPESAVAVAVRSVWTAGSTSRKVRLTVSPGHQPWPVIVAVSPGW
jgi:hypothetical protein